MKPAERLLSATTAYGSHGYGVGGHWGEGEWITIALMKTAVRMLTTGMRCDVPAQDLGINLSAAGVADEAFQDPQCPASRLIPESQRRRIV